VTAAAHVDRARRDIGKQRDENPCQFVGAAAEESEFRGGPEMTAQSEREANQKRQIRANHRHVKRGVFAGDATRPHLALVPRPHAARRIPGQPALSSWRIPGASFSERFTRANTGPAVTSGAQPAISHIAATSLVDDEKSGCSAITPSPFAKL